MAPHLGVVTCHAKDRAHQRLSLCDSHLLSLANFLARRWPLMRKRRRYLEVFNASGDLCGYVIFERRGDRGVSIITMLSDEMYPPRSLPKIEPVWLDNNSNWHWYH